MKLTKKQAKYSLNSMGEFVIENYNYSKPFSNFFPGISGRYGIPMWTFYVNRGQAISSFGIKDKDHAILEFLPANKAWQAVTSHGFRTFIKVISGSKASFYEPFQNGFSNTGFSISNKMLISPWGLVIEENNATLGLAVRVEYFNIPSDNYGGLARILTLKNLSKTKKVLELIDGLPQIVPYGTNNFFLKEMSRTIEAWMNAENIDKRAPFYRLMVDPADRPEVVHIKEGNFYLGFMHDDNKKPRLLTPIVDPEAIFMESTDFSYPRNFIESKEFNFPLTRGIKSKTPSAFSFASLNLCPGKEKTVYSVIGYMRSIDTLNKSIPKITAYGYLNNKKKENRELIEGITSDIRTASSSERFNLYCRQTYLDNLLRGGYPFTFPSGTTFYLYSRKHGDPERDYNRFQLTPTYFSQGNGNYRDLNQNRRMDIWFNPQIKEENLISLFNLIQLDGFNPLVVKGSSFILNNIAVLKNELVQICSSQDSIEKVVHFLNKPFSPGDLALFLEDHNIKLKCEYDRFLDTVLKNSARSQDAEHGEGFWTDHWHYNLDLLEKFLGVYPERLTEILFKMNKFTFFDNSEIVKPRKEKYVLYNGLPRQLHSVVSDLLKKEMIHKRHEMPHTVRTSNGHGEIYTTTLFNKLACILANKFASLDPFGVGVEMESDKPNWFDALNGLPALLGSSLCETFELKRLAIFMKQSLISTGIQKIKLLDEVYDFLYNLNAITSENLNGEIDEFTWWDRTHTVKEDYRLKVKLGVNGNESDVSSLEIIGIIDTFLKKMENGISKAWSEKEGVYYGYFINEVSEYIKVSDNFIKPSAFKQIRVPLFLEAQMHAIRLADNNSKALAIYKGTRKSALFDRKLKMYKVTASLKSMPEEIGRCRVFPAGWLENESIWLHMEYKYILEILRQGLHKEFYSDFKNVLIPFQKPERYGRSILENSSFIVSSAFIDTKLHGNGFVARLSGSTAELLEIWLIMNVGVNPFSLDEKNRLLLDFKPKLAGWLFDKKGSYGFNFLGNINVTYHNPTKKDTFGQNSAKIKKFVFSDPSGSVIETTPPIMAPYAEMIRDRQINKIDVYFK